MGFTDGVDVVNDNELKKLNIALVSTALTLFEGENTKKIQRLLPFIQY